MFNVIWVKNYIKNEKENHACEIVCKKKRKKIESYELFDCIAAPSWIRIYLKWTIIFKTIFFIILDYFDKEIAVSCILLLHLIINRRVNYFS